MKSRPVPVFQLTQNCDYHGIEVTSDMGGKDVTITLLISIQDANRLYRESGEDPAVLVRSIVTRLNDNDPV